MFLNNPRHGLHQQFHNLHLQQNKRELLVNSGTLSKSRTWSNYKLRLGETSLQKLLRIVDMPREL